MMSIRYIYHNLGIIFLLIKINDKTFKDEI